MNYTITLSPHCKFEQTTLVHMTLYCAIKSDVENTVDQIVAADRKRIIIQSELHLASLNTFKIRPT